MGLGPLIVDVLKSRNPPPTSVRLLWMSDRPVSETSSWQPTKLSQETNIHYPGGIRTHRPRKQSPAHPLLRPRSEWDLQNFSVSFLENCEDLSPSNSIERTESCHSLRRIWLSAANDRALLYKLRSTDSHCYFQCLCDLCYYRVCRSNIMDPLDMLLS